MFRPNEAMSRKAPLGTFYGVNSEAKLTVDFYGISNKIDKVSIF